MESLKTQAAALKTSWERVYAAIRTNPSVYQSHLPGANADQLNEVVETVIYWFDRVRPPKGFGPAYHLARSLAGSSLVSAATAAEALARGEYAHFPAFILSITQVLAGLHSLLVFGDRTESGDAVADLGTKLAESLALVGTAQRELAAKVEQLRSADSSLEAARLAAEQSAAHATQAGAALKAAEEKAGEAEAKTAKIAELLAESSDVTVQLAQDATTAGTTLANVKRLESELGALTTKTREQQDLIAALLPKGASAGLASAFALRVAQLERTRWLWMGGFVASILGLVGIAVWILWDTSQTNTQLWLQILQRIPLAAPLIWSGWFSAVQYGNTLRVQEDYAFKEAMAKAFAGFHDHLEHMAAIAQEDGASAMAVLYGKTMEALAREPLRIFQRPDKDATPSHALLDSIRTLAEGAKPNAPKTGAS